MLVRMWRKEQSSIAGGMLPVPPELAGTKPPTKNYTWRDPWLQLHMQQKIAISDMNEKKGHWSYEGSVSYLTVSLTLWTQ